MRKRKTPIIISLAIIGVLLITGVTIINLNPNSRKYYKIYERDGSYYYKNLFSSIGINLLYPKKVCLEFSDGLALIHEKFVRWGSVYDGLDVWKYIDSSGQTVLRFDFCYADVFSEGLAAVMPYDGGYWGYINKSGEMVIEPQFSRASIFNDGVASVYMGNEDRWILINQYGEYVRDLDEP
ncbi:MAG: WG repeat-containing protein [Defluviitaleaceae bacterium]|nr:WG repeat-containing protein [Defluviitaleaceae bacterium]